MNQISVDVINKADLVTKEGSYTYHQRLPGRGVDQREAVQSALRHFIDGCNGCKVRRLQVVDIDSWGPFKVDLGACYKRNIQTLERRFERARVKIAREKRRIYDEYNRRFFNKPGPQEGPGRVHS